MMMITFSGVKKSDFLTLEDETDKLSRNVVKEYHCALCNIPEECRSHLLCGGILKSPQVCGLLCRMKIDIDFWTVCVYEEARFSGRGAGPQRWTE